METLYWVEQSTVSLNNLLIRYSWEKKKNVFDGLTIETMDMVSIRINGKMVRVSRLVCEKIHGPPDISSNFALHSCGNGHLGCVNPKHLRWGTPKENSLEMVRHGNSTRGIKNARAILTEEIVLWIKRELAKGKKPTEIGKELGVKRSTIKNIENGSNWAWLHE